MAWSNEVLCGFKLRTIVIVIGNNDDDITM